MPYAEPPEYAHRFETEQEADTYMATRHDDYFEYGHQQITVDEQREALTGLIEDCTNRLKRLDETGSQWLPSTL